MTPTEIYRAAQKAAREAATKAGLRVHGQIKGHHQDTCRRSRLSDASGSIVGEAYAFPGGGWGVVVANQLVAEGNVTQEVAA